MTSRAGAYQLAMVDKAVQLQFADLLRCARLVHPRPVRLDIPAARAAYTSRAGLVSFDSAALVATDPDGEVEWGWGDRAVSMRFAAGAYGPEPAPGARPDELQYELEEQMPFPQVCGHARTHSRAASLTVARSSRRRCCVG